jgi:hypothetical protein
MIDLLLYLLLAVTALIPVYLGGHMAATPPETRESKRRYKISFAVLCVISLVLIVIIGFRQHKATEKAEATQKATLGAQTETQQRVGTLENKVNQIYDKTFEPGNPTEKLEKIAVILGVNKPPVVALQFGRRIPLQAGSHDLFGILSAGGYVGPTKVQEVTICNKSDDGGPFYRGDSPRVNADNGVPIDDCDTERACDSQRDFIDLTSIHLYTAKPSHLAVLVRALK